MIRLQAHRARWNGCQTCVIAVVLAATAPLSPAQSNYVDVYHFTTLAGTPSLTGGAADGRGPAALFRRPRGVAVSTSGDVYVADSGNYAIRKITPAGVVTTYAGKLGSAGTMDGGAADARFAGPTGLSLDDRNSLFVADGAVIRWIAPPSSLFPTSSTITQTGRSASGQSTDGPGWQAGFIAPQAIATNTGASELYVVDRIVCTVRKLSEFRPPFPPSGTVTTIAGTPHVNGYADGAALAAVFGDPSGLAIDAARTIYIADTGNHVIRKVSPEGIVSTLAGARNQRGSADGPGAQARFQSPNSLAVDARGNVYVTDADNHLIRRITPDGRVTTLAGNPGVSGSQDGTGTSAKFKQPNGIAIDAAGNLYVADYGNNTIRVGRRNRAPSVTAGDATTRPLQPVTLSLSGSDPDGDRFVFEIGRVTGGAAVISGDEVIFTPAADFLGTATVTVTATDGYDASSAATIRINVDGPPYLRSQPQSQAAVVNSPVTLTVTASATFQWQVNGRDIPGATNASVTLPALQPADSGIYQALCRNVAGLTLSDPAVVGTEIGTKVIGTARELSPSDLLHPNGRTFDQLLLEGTATAFTADAGQVTRISFVDLDDDIVQVELSGPGTVSLLLDSASGPARPQRYRQDILYMKGHAGIVVAGATQDTHLSIFSVGKANAFDPTGQFDFLRPITPDNDPAHNGSPLFRVEPPVEYDGLADIAFVAILSSDGRFGGLRTANVNYFAARGFTGVYAPAISFSGPVYVGDISAFDLATPVLIVGSTADARITGGDLFQPNSRPVGVDGLSRLMFSPGTDSHGRTLPAQANRARLEQSGVDVTSRIVVNP